MSASMAKVITESTYRLVMHCSSMHKFDVKNSGEGEDSGGGDGHDYYLKKVKTSVKFVLVEY